MSPRNSVVTWYPDLSPHHERMEKTKEEDNLAEEDKRSLRLIAPLEAWMTTCRSSQSKQKTLWYVPSYFSIREMNLEIDRLFY